MYVQKGHREQIDYPLISCKVMATVVVQNIVMYKLNSLLNYKVIGKIVGTCKKITVNKLTPTPSTSVAI